MAGIHKKVINTWDGGIKTSIRDSNPDTSDGAQLIRHFDIYSDPKKLVPMPSWASFATDAEKAYNIRALGGVDDTVYGLGSALSNWYSSYWGYRVEITAASGTLINYFDLANMPSTFWDNVNENGSDIRVVDSNGEMKGCNVTNFDRDAETGEIWTNVSTDTWYIYYGYASSTDNGSIITNESVPFISNEEKAYESLNWMFHFDGDTVNAADTDVSLSTGDARYASGDVAEALTASTVTGSNDDGLGNMGDDPFIFFRIYIPTAASGSDIASMISHTGGNFDLDLTNGNKITYLFNGSSNNPSQTTTPTLSADTWHSVAVHFFNENVYVYFDGALVHTHISNSGTIDEAAGAISVKTFGPGGSILIDNLFSCNLNSDGLTTALSLHNQLSNNAAQYTVGSQVAFSTFAKQYSGVQLYTKSISSGDWQEYITNGQPVRSLSAYPVNGFIEGSGPIYFITSQNADDGGLLFLSVTKNFGSTTLDTSHLLLTVLSTNKVRPTAQSAYDGTVYFNFGTSSIGTVADPGTDDEFAASGMVLSMMAWRNYLAIGSTSRTRARVEIWDLVQADNLEFIDAGTGNLRVVGNASDTLFAVVDNYIDDAVLSSNQPKMEIKEYVGNGRMESVIKIDVPTTYTGWTDDWERAVSFFKVRRNTETLFYAKLPADDTATTFNEGFWAVGKNSQGKLALSLMIDTSDLGEPENVHGFAQQVFLVQKDGGIQRLATDGTYDKVSLYKTRIMNEGNSELEKKLVGIELVTEPLAAGQTVTVYSKKVGEDRVKIGDFTGTGEIAFEKVTNDDGTNLPNYQEIEFQIESTGGKSAILEFNYRFEYLSDII